MAEEEKKTRFETQAINDEILDKMSLKNRYAFLNTNLTAVLNPTEFNFLKKIQKFCMRFERKHKITHGPEEDVYDWIPEFGKEGFIARSEPFEILPEGICNTSFII